MCQFSKKKAISFKHFWRENSNERSSLRSQYVAKCDFLSDFPTLVMRAKSFG